MNLHPLYREFCFLSLFKFFIASSFSFCPQYLICLSLSPLFTIFAWISYVHLYLSNLMRLSQAHLFHTYLISPTRLSLSLLYLRVRLYFSYPKRSSLSSLSRTYVLISLILRPTTLSLLSHAIVFITFIPRDCLFTSRLRLYLHYLTRSSLTPSSHTIRSSTSPLSHALAFIYFISRDRLCLTRSCLSPLSHAIVFTSFISRYVFISRVHL